MTAFGRPDTTLDSWQDVKIQLLIVWLQRSRIRSVFVGFSRLAGCLALWSIPQT